MVKMQCDGINKDGTSCQRMVTFNGWNFGSNGGLYCHWHREETITEAPNNSPLKQPKLTDKDVLQIELTNFLKTMISLAVTVFGITLGLFMLGSLLYIMEITGLSDNDFLTILILGIIGYISLSIASSL